MRKFSQLPIPMPRRAWKHFPTPMSSAMTGRRAMA